MTSLRGSTETVEAVRKSEGRGEFVFSGKRLPTLFAAVFQDQNCGDCLKTSGEPAFASFVESQAEDHSP